MTQRTQPRRLVPLALVAAALLAPAVPSHADPCPSGLNQIDFAMYFLSDVRDAELCAQEFADGQWTTPEGLENPAMTCPDMFSWRLFMESVLDEWWSRWADETQNWPAEPYQLCSQGGTPGKSCCEPGNPDNPKGHCPVFPGDAAVLKAHERAAGEAGPPPKEEMRIGRPSIMTHLNDLAKVEPEVLRRDLATLKAPSPELPEGPPSIVDHLVPEEYESIGRVIRQTNAEITVRDRSFHYFLFDNDLYNENGVEAVFEKNSTNLTTNAPYRAASHAVYRDGGTADLARIDLPPEAIMIKSNWLNEALAAKLGIEEDPAHPFIKKYLATTINLDPQGSEQCLLTGVHYLVAFHVSSKDIPNWVWATFEHVNLPGRCDVTGCNDSYGFVSSDELPEGAADNYVKPHTHWDDLNSGTCVYDRDLVYSPEAIRKPLAELFDQLGIGVAPSRSPNEPTPRDLGWRSYRLKGSQVEFTNSMGRTTLLGNSVTEAGFMDGSSCITCHARAGIHVDANGDSTFFKLGVFENSLSDYGYARSSHGIPNKNWFHDSAQPPQLEVLQTDFSWGFLFAQPLVTP
jgi:hypothetical protein